MNTRRPAALVGVLVIAMIIEGLDMQLLALVAPLVMTEWGLTKAAFGPALSAALVGMSVGPVAGGWLGDRLGRRRTLVAAVVVFALTTVLVALTHSVVTLVALRVLGGFAFGATAPNAMSLAIELLPLALHARVISWLSMGTPLGGLIGAAVLGLWLPLLGWRGSFALFGGLSLLIAAAVYRVIPPTPVPTALPAPSSTAPTAGDIRTPGWRFTVGTWLAFFFSTYVAYGCLAWVPTLTVVNGLPLSDGLRAMFVFNLLALISAITGGFLVQAFGTRRVLVLAGLVVGAAIAVLLVLFGKPPSQSHAVVAFWFASATGLVGGGTGLLLATGYLVVVQGHPAVRRAAAVGLAMLVGRGGGVLSSGLGGRLLGNAPGHAAPFFELMLCAVAGVLVAVALLGAQAREPAQ